MKAAECRAAWANDPLAIAWLDLDGTIVEANTAFATLLGMDEDSLPGRVLSDLVDAPQVVQALLGEVTQEKTGRQRELRLGGSNGQSQQFVCDVAPVMDGERCIGSRWFLIPKAGSAASTQPASDPALDVRGIVHQLRNPLASLTSGLDLLEIEDADEETVRVMRHALEQLGRSVDALLQPSRASSRESPVGIDSPTTPPQTSASPSRARTAPRILIVDDNEAICRSLTLLFHGLKLRDVAAAVTGEEALQKFNELRPEIVLLDIGLPDMDGFEVANQIRRSPGGEAALLVALSGYGQRDDRARSVAAGFDEHLVKPCGVDSILKLLHHPKLTDGGSQLSPEDSKKAAGHALENSPASLPRPHDGDSQMLLQRTGEFLREVVHDSRTAAFPLQVQLHVLQKAEPRGDHQNVSLLKEYLAMVDVLHAALRRAGMLLRDEFQCERRSVDLAEVLNRACDEFRKSLKGDALTITVDAEPGLVVAADRDLLIQGVTELLANARQATGAEGRIMVQLAACDGVAAVSVRDEGSGLSANDCERAIRPFERLGRKLEPLKGRVGLGLAIASRIAAAHSGRLRLAAASPSGCEAILEIPLPGAPAA